jgi:hypothetical protein
MTDQSERLERMAEYSFHMARADQERARSVRAADRIACSLHEELAMLHEIAAADLSDAWQPWNDPRAGITAARKAYQEVLAES